MDQLDGLLDEVRACVRSADFAALARLSPQLGMALDEMGAQVDALALGRLKAKAGENAALLDAARRGVRAARRRVDEACRAAQGLQTYDAKGRRADISPAGATTGRF